MGSASDQRRDGQLGGRRGRGAAAALGLAVLLLASAWPAVAIDAAPPADAAFPPPLDRYTGEEGISLLDVLARRARQEAMNVVATVIFVLAILHTFAAPKLLQASHRLRRRWTQSAARERTASLSSCSTCWERWRRCSGSGASRCSSPSAC